MKMAATLIVGALLIGVALGAVGAYWYFAPEEVVPPTYVPTERERAVDISASLNTTTFNFTTDVDANGSVGTAATIDKTLTITNNDEKTARDLMIALYNPVTEREGLSDYLEVEAFEAYIVGTTVSNAIYYGAGYIEDTTTSPITYGYNIGNLAPGGTATITFRITLDTCVDGTFQDGQTYSAQRLYVYQPHGDYCNTVSFSVLT